MKATRSGSSCDGARTAGRRDAPSTRNDCPSSKRTDCTVSGSGTVVCDRDGGRAVLRADRSRFEDDALHGRDAISRDRLAPRAQRNSRNRATASAVGGRERGQSNLGRISSRRVRGEDARRCVEASGAGVRQGNRRRTAVDLRLRDDLELNRSAGLCADRARWNADDWRRCHAVVPILRPHPRPVVPAHRNRHLDRRLGASAVRRDERGHVDVVLRITEIGRRENELAAQRIESRIGRNVFSAQADAVSIGIDGRDDETQRRADFDRLQHRSADDRSVIAARGRSFRHRRDDDARLVVG